MGLTGLLNAKTAARVGVTGVWFGLGAASVYVETVHVTPTDAPAVWAGLAIVGLLALVVSQLAVSRSMTRASEWEDSEEAEE